MKDWIMELCPEIAEWQAEMLEVAALNMALAEREECAKECEAVCGTDIQYPYAYSRGVSDCAAAIRARGHQGEREGSGNE